MKNPLILSAVMFASLYSATASAHATFEQKEATINQNYKAVIRIPHGCKGSATTSVSVTLPEGVIKAKPMPKAGWDIDVVRGKYENTYQYHGEVTEGVKSITWKGGKLPNDFYDEFVFRARVTDHFKANEVIYLPVIQTCESGSNKWVEIPEAGQDAHDLKRPAPSITAIENTSHGHHH